MAAVLAVVVTVVLFGVLFYAAKPRSASQRVMDIRRESFRAQHEMRGLTQEAIDRMAEAARRRQQP